MAEMEYTNLYEAIEAYCRDFEAAYKRELEKDGRRATGALIDNLYCEVKSGGATINVILNVADYYRYVEQGRKAGKFPPPDKILQWVRRKPVIPRPDKNGKLPTEKQLAFLIGRKIAEEGTEGKPSLKNSVEEVNRRYVSILQEALEKDFGVYEMKVLDEINKMVRI